MYRYVPLAPPPRFRSNNPDEPFFSLPLRALPLCSACAMGDAEPSSPLSALLGKIGQHAALLKELGYDEVADFDKVGDEELAVLKSTLLERGVPAGHIGRLERLFLGKRPQPKVEPPRTPIPAPVPPPQEPLPQASGEAHAPAAEADAAAAAEAVDDLEPKDLTHWPKVKEFLDNANGRTIFGCGPTKASVVLSTHEVAMNQAAVELLRAKPQLMGWEGRAPKKGDLIRACRALIEKRGYNFVKGTSRSKDAETPPSGSSRGKAPARVVVSRDQRELRLLELPGLINNLREKDETLTKLKEAAMQRNDNDEALNHITALGEVQMEQSALVREQVALKEAARTARRNAQQRKSGGAALPDDDADADVRTWPPRSCVPLFDLASPPSHLDLCPWVADPRHPREL